MTRLRHFPQVSHRLSLKTLLIIPFALQLIVTVGLIEYLSLRNGQQAVERLAQQLLEEAGDRTQQHLETYTEMPQQVVQLLVDDLELGSVNFNTPNLQTLDPYFLKRVQRFPSVSFIYIGDAQGRFIGAGPVRSRGYPTYIIEAADASTDHHYVSYATDAQGQRTQVLNAVPNYDPRRRPWYEVAVQRNQPTWSPIYAFIGEANEGLTITAVEPFQTPTGQLAGVAAVDLYLNDISEFLKQLKISQAAQVFIVEPSGLLIASSGQQAPYSQAQGQVIRVSAIASEDILVQATAQYLQTQIGGLDQIEQRQHFTFSLQGQRQFVQVTPWHDRFGLNWVIVAVVPAQDFVGPIYAQTYRTIFLSGIALGIAVLIGYLTARWASLPILRLNTAAQKLARGEWHHRIKIHRADEVGQLAQSFNRMAEQLQTSFSELQDLNQALSTSKAELNQILAALPVGVMVIKADGSLLYLNPHGKTLLGIAEPSPKVPLEQLAAVYQAYRAGTQQLYPTQQLPLVQALAGNRVSVDDLVLQRGQQVIRLEVQGTPVFDTQGQVLYAIATFQDITENKQAELALRQSESRFRRLTENIPGVVYRYTMRPDGSEAFTYMSPRFQAIYDLDSALVLSDSTYFWQLIDPDDRSELRATIAQSYHTLQPWSLEYRITTPSGHRKWIQTFASPERQANGDVIWDGLVLEVTDRKQAEQVLADYNRTLEEQVRERTLALEQEISDRKHIETALRESEYFLQRIADAVPQILYLFDLTSGTTVYLNQQSLGVLGYTSEEICNAEPEWLIEQFHPDDRHLCYGLPTRFNHLSDQEVLSTEYQFRHKNGSWRWLNTREVVFTRDEQGLPTQVLGSVQDISDRKHAEAALQQANLALQHLAAVDSLTQVANRRRFDEYLEQEWYRSARQGQPLSLILCDVDYFKQFNDCYGHPKGDDCLIQIAQTMSHVLKRSTDLIARYGGEEFGVILPNVFSEGAIAVAHMIQAAIQQLQIPHRESQISDVVTVSLGIATLIPLSDQSFNTLIGLADQALYEAKARGRDRFWVSQVHSSPV